MGLIINFFHFFKEKNKRTNENKDLSELVKKMEKLEQIIEKLDDKKIEYHINVEKLDINDPVIENLTFRLDNLDIKDLSGALNLGTNFGITVNQDEKKKKTPSESKESGKFQTKKTSNAKETDTVVNQNSKGYSFKFNNGRE